MSLVFTSSRLTASSFCIATPRHAASLTFDRAHVLAERRKRDRNIVRHDEQWPVNCASWRKRS